MAGTAGLNLDQNNAECKEISSHRLSAEYGPGIRSVALFLEISWMFSGNFPDSSWKFPGNFVECSKKLPGQFTGTEHSPTSVCVSFFPFFVDPYIGTPI